MCVDVVVILASKTYSSSSLLTTNYIHVFNYIKILIRKTSETFDNVLKQNNQTIGNFLVLTLLRPCKKNAKIYEHHTMAFLVATAWEWLTFNFLSRFYGYTINMRNMLWVNVGFNSKLTSNAMNCLITIFILGFWWNVEIERSRLPNVWFYRSEHYTDSPKR